MGLQGRTGGPDAAGPDGTDTRQGPDAAGALPEIERRDPMRRGPASLSFWRYARRRSGTGPVAQPVFKTGEVV
jgi:hypothetical protein